MHQPTLSECSTITPHSQSTWEISEIPEIPIPEIPWTSSSSFTPSGSRTPRTPATDSLSEKKLPFVDLQHVNDSTSYEIVQISERDDDGRVGGFRRLCYKLSPIFAVILFGSYWTYFMLRILFVYAAQVKDGEFLYIAWTFIGIDIVVAVPTFYQLFWALGIWKSRNRLRLRLLGDNVPRVDVIITACREEVEVIADTAIAACNVDCPLDKFRVWIFDDGKDAELQASVQRLIDRYELKNLYYRARDKHPDRPHHFKAGNLNYAIAETLACEDGFGNKRSSLLACLDADMIPEKHWIRATIPHLLIDDTVSMACPPQLFYNIPKGDTLAQDLAFFTHTCEPVKDALGVAWCTGSGYVVRRDALEDIGNIPVGNLAEDVETSTMLLGRGWKTTYVHEPLQFGLIPGDFLSHLKQRTRWSIGTLQTSITLKFCLWGPKVENLKFWPRISGFIFSTSAMFSLPLLMSLFALPVVIVADKPCIAYANGEQLRLLIWSSFAVTVCSAIGEYVIFTPAGYANGLRSARSHIWMAPYISLSLIRAFVLPAWAGGKVQSFQPTGSIRSGLNERDESLRAPTWRRLRTVLVDYMAWPHLALIYLLIICLTIATSRCVFRPPLYLFTPIQSEATPYETTLEVTAALWQPIVYAIFPPTMPLREELLLRDEKTGVARARDDYKSGGWSETDIVNECLTWISRIFATFVFIVSFIWL